MDLIDGGRFVAEMANVKILATKDGQPPGAMRAEHQNVLDVARAVGAGDEHIA